MLHEIMYIDNGDIAVYNGYSFRRDKRNGYYLSSRRIGEKRQRLHRYVWKTENSAEIPKGYDIHHIDGDKSHNDVTNLQLIEDRCHVRLHSTMLTEEERKKRAENIVAHGVPAAKAWHRSEEGRKWHIQHGKDVFGDRPYIEYTCDFCGSKFKSRNVYKETSHRFCSNNCKAAFRRASGVDNIKMECKFCGKIFETNKYSPAKYCEEHKDRKYRVRRA